MKEQGKKTFAVLPELLKQQDLGYRDFIAKLIPTKKKDVIIGVRAPAMKAIGRDFLKADPLAIEAFLQDLPHYYYEENLLHGIVIGALKTYEASHAAVNRFLPYVDNWAVCDSLDPVGLCTDKAKLKTAIRRWLDADHEYTVRFAIGQLMSNYLTEDFAPFVLEWVAEVDREEYYINMMVAWFFATALTKRYDDTVPYLEESRLPLWNHNKAIQKAVESRQIPAETKEYLRTLRRRKKR